MTGAARPDARVLPASFPALLHLALAFPGRPPLASRHPYLLGWVYCVPLLTTTAWLTARIMAPFLGNHTACNLGILLVERFHSAPPAVQFTLGMLSLLAVAGLARWTGWAIREKGWRQGVWQRPIQTTAMLVAVPPCGALSLAAGFRPRAAHRLAGTLVFRHVASDPFAGLPCTATTLLSFHYTADLGRRWTLGGSVRRFHQDVADTAAHTIEEIALEGPARVLIRTDGNTEFVHVLGRRTRIGRGSDNELVLDTKHVSRYHAVLLAGPAHTTIEDLNSTNGVFVNGKRVSRQALKDGDRINIGRTQFRYTVRG